MAAPVEKLMGGSSVAVKRHHDLEPFAKELPEALLGEPVRVDVGRGQHHQIDDVHDSHGQIRYPSAQ